ncbi:putative diguanylate cyclase AdrA [compost metagenome]
MRQLSIELKCNLRESDLAGRYGGDEFCVILPNMPLNQAMDVMERLRKVLQDYRHREVPELRVSLSIGLAAYQPSFADATAWLDDTDKALYIAKNTGRNKVSVNLGNIGLETSTV